jgi:hypothetical protein
MPEVVERLLSRIVDDAYRIFEPYKIASGTRLTVCYCNCCMTSETEAALRETPLRSLSSALLSEYTNSAHGCDDYITREFRYFLPRYMELMAEGYIPCGLGLECTFRRIEGVDWRNTWPSDEVRVIEDFFDALLFQHLQDVSLAEWPAGWFLETDISDVLVLVVRSNGDLDRVLRRLDSAPDPNAAIHMAAARRHIAWRNDAYRHDSAFLDRYQDQAAVIGAFLMRPEVDKRLEASFFVIDDPRLQRIVSDATAA